MECLRVKGFCVINDVLTEDELREAAAEVPTLDFYQPAVLVQEGLLGMEGSNRVAKLEDDGSSGGMRAALRDLCEVVGPCQENIGFRCWGMSQCIVHEAGDPLIEEAELTDEEASDWCSVFMSRKIQFLMFLGPDKGMLEMTPYDEDCPPCELTTSCGLVVAVRTDQINTKFYTRGSKANYVASRFMLQTDVLRMHRQKVDEHMTPAAKDIDTWLNSRLQEIKEQTSGEDTNWDQLDVPRHLIYAANRSYFTRQMQVVKGAAVRAPSSWESEVWFLALTTGLDVVTEIPTLRWEHSDVYDPDPEGWRQMPPKTSCRHGSFYEGVEMFDAKLFGLSVAETKGMDPCQRQVLETTYDALFRSGMSKKTLINSTCGMYVGMGQSEWNYAERSMDVGIFGATGGAPSICAGRLSFCLGCKGASLAIDTEAASSLSAVFWAAESVEKKGLGNIQDLACGIGVHLLLARQWFAAHSASGFLSPEGRCLTFDATASGHVRMDATGCLVVRNKAEIVDGKEVLYDDNPPVGEIVGGATASSGRSSSLTAPSGPAEQAVLLDACRKSGIMPQDVDMVETHCVGKVLPDAVEVASIGTALRGGSDEMLQLNATKAHCGNSIETSGAVSMVKMMHSIKWGIVTANVHLRQLNPHLQLDECPVLLGDEHLEQRSTDTFAGVTAHGWGGTNVHIQCFGGRDEGVRLPPQPTPEPLRPRLAYWPAGGGDLGGVNRPRRGYFLVGSWNNWEPTQQMESEGDGCFGATIVLEPVHNGTCLFQIWIDGSNEKVLHPYHEDDNRELARSGYGFEGSEVHGPSRDEFGDLGSWGIQPEVSVDEHQAGAAPAALVDAGAGEGGLQKLAADSPEGAELAAVLPNRYRVRLHVAGKWRTVTWSKVQE